METTHNPDRYELSSKELRGEDIKKLWRGIEIFRHDNPSLEENLSTQITTIAERRNEIDLAKKRMETGLEIGMTFLYGAHLAKDLKPGITASVKVPELYVKRDDQISHEMLCTMEDDAIIVGDTHFNLGFSRLFYPLWTTSHTVTWLNETTQTVSSNLRDITIVDALLAGVEEYAHEVFVRLKSPQKLAKSYSREKKIAELDQSEWQNPLTAEMYHHLSDVERKGLVWQQKILDKYLPHWASPTRAFVDCVSFLRQWILENPKK